MSLNGVANATYHYDVINRLTQLTDNASLNTTFAYDATNKLTSRMLPNGVVTTSQYDGLDRLTRLTHAKSGNTVADFQYQFNAVNNITQMIDGAGAHNYSYDTRDRLTAATHPNQPNESYTLDDVGNRTASHQGSSYTYQSFNRVTAANGMSFSYNANGNLISKTDASGTWTYSWDFEDRLKQASKSGGVTVTYSYDGLGRYVQRTSTIGGAKKFVYDSADVIRDLDGSGATIADYLNGPGIDNKLRQVTGGSASYFLTDHLGTTRAFTDSSGNIASSLSYDSFGNLFSGSPSTRYTYTGREIDADVGLMCYRARWYDPPQGRFISEDPIGLDGGIDLYSYVENSPVRFSDPLGLQRLPHLGPILSPKAGTKPNSECDEPCNSPKNWPSKLRDFREIGDKIGWRIANNGRPIDVRRYSFREVQNRLENAGFENFPNINPPHWGGMDYEGKVNSRWYHVTIDYPSSLDPRHPPKTIHIQCQRYYYKPYSWDHFSDWWKSWLW